jgi:hypothetical protein
MAVTVIHKRGDTFDQLLLIPDSFADGYWIGWTATSQIRTARGKLIAPLTVSWADPAADTRVMRLFNDETAGWPVGDLEIDVQFVRNSDGLTRSTETIAVTILRDVTQP